MARTWKANSEVVERFEDGARAMADSEFSACGRGQQALIGSMGFCAEVSFVEYSVGGYGKMILDKSRIGAYSDALRSVVRDGSVVLDIGTGTGILALLACRFGARKVYAVEPAEIIQLARQAAADSGFADRIEFIQGISTQIDLREKVEIIVSDVHGVLANHTTGVSSIMDARERFLAPGGRLIPQQDTLWAALAQAADAYGEVVEAWENNDLDFDFQAIRSIAVNSISKLVSPGNPLITDPRQWATLDYRTLSSPDVNGRAAWTIKSTSAAHGLAVWFDSELTDGIGFSNSPDSPTKQIYGQGFFPWPRPVDLSLGDEVSVHLHAVQTGDDYVWCWNTDITGGAAPRRTLASFRQSTFLGAPLSVQSLRKRTQMFVPTLNEDGRIDRAILLQMADGLSLDQIARSIGGQFAHRFATWQDALNRVANLSARYSL
jgi:type I protein arginine methyltransferase